MPISAVKTINTSWILKKIAAVKKRFEKDVVFIDHRFGSDWTGDPGMFFRIVVTDAVAKDDDRLLDVTVRVSRDLIDTLQVSESEWIPYFNYWSVSERKKDKRF